MSFLIGYLPNSLSQKLIACYFTLKAWQTVGFKGFHSIQQECKMSEMIVKILPALQDNYMYLLIDSESNEAAIVDPVAPDTVLKAVEENNVNLTTVLTTHHHWDHAGGNEQLVNKFMGVQKLKVYGNDDRIGALTNKVQQDDEIQIGSLKIRCIFTPGHTSGHTCYYTESPNLDRAVFTGDTLFSAGCGKFFEGTAEQSHVALMEKLYNLPDETKVFCGHEYTVQNLAFAEHVEPNNENIKKKIHWAKTMRQQNIPTIPSTIGEEKKINPFMRVNVDDVKKHVDAEDEIEVLSRLRKEKNIFRG